MLVVLAVLITFMTTTLLMYKKFADAYDTGTSIGESTTATSGSKKDVSLVKTLETFKAMLEQKYIGEIDEEQLIEGAIKGYVEALGDPYTQYLTKDEMQEFKEETSGEYVGIGVYVTNYKVDNTILVVGVMKGSPALEAGMQAGDIIEKVDGVEYTTTESVSPSGEFKKQVTEITDIDSTALILKELRNIVNSSQGLDYELVEVRRKLNDIIKKYSK